MIELMHEVSEHGYALEDESKLPDGEGYCGMICGAKEVQHKNGDLSVVFDVGIMKGELAGRVTKLWIARRCAASNKKLKAGQMTLDHLLKAFDMERCGTAEELFDKPFSFDLVSKDNYQNFRNIRKYVGEDIVVPPSHPEVADAPSWGG